MTAGVPGLGLSGLFALLSALALPITRRNTDRRRQVLTAFVFAIVISVALLGAWEVASMVAAAVSRSGRDTPTGVPIMLISMALMFGVVGMAEGLFQVLTARPTPTPEPILAPRLRRTLRLLPVHTQWAIVERCASVAAADQRATELVEAGALSPGDDFRFFVAATGESHAAVYARRVRTTTPEEDHRPDARAA
jgi:uncharacterized membrane protein YidH (DUF202 family)